MFPSTTSNRSCPPTNPFSRLTQSPAMHLAAALSNAFQNSMQRKIACHEPSSAGWDGAVFSGGRLSFPSTLSYMLSSARISATKCMSVENGSMKPKGRCGCGCVICDRRAFFGLTGVTLCAEIASSSCAFEIGDQNYMKTLEMIHPQRPDWYEEVYAQSMLLGMQPYEAEVAAYKLQLFNQFDSTVEKILELGVGTGPNMRYYANRNNVTVIGVDPNKHMEKYAREAANKAGFSCSQFKFLQAVAERLPIPDSSVDAIVCTLVLCSVKDVSSSLREVQRVLKPGGKFLFVEHVAAKEGTWLRFFQNVLGPLQELVADGCHLNRDTLDNVQRVGFASLNAQLVNINSISLISPHIIGIAQK